MIALLRTKSPPLAAAAAVLIAGCNDLCCAPEGDPAELALRQVVLSGRPLAGVVADPAGYAWTSQVIGPGYLVSPEGDTERLQAPIGLGSDRAALDLDAAGRPIYGVWYRGVAIADRADSTIDYTVYDGTGGCLPSNRVTAVRGNPDGSILVAVARSEGITRVDPAQGGAPCPRWTSENSAMALGPGVDDTDGWIAGISQARNGERWVAVNQDALYRWRDGGTPADPDDDQWTAYLPSDRPELTSTQFAHLTRGPLGGLWVATQDGLIVVRDGVWTRVTELISLSVQHVDFGPEGFAWVSTGDGISVLSVETLRERAQYGLFSGLPDRSVTAIAFDPTGTYAYVATGEGMAIMDRVDGD